MKISTEQNQLQPGSYREAKNSAKTVSRNDFQRLLNEIKQTNTPPLRATPAAPRQSPRAGISTDNTVTVKEGDTLFNIAQKTLQQRGLAAGQQESMRTALQLARENGLSNPNLILPGQKITLSSLETQDAEKGPQAARQTVLDPRLTGPKSAPARPANRQLQSTPQVTAHPILEKTLDRAVKLQYMTAEEKAAVKDKILKIASEHNFNPDDLAVVTLIESDGMNPKASNGRCHGVIQFCDGTNRGAASVGYKDNPRGILELPVLDQLDLIDKYFEETGLKSFAKRKTASLDDLYLTVLTPAARRERDMNTYLDIAGQQAAVLRTSAEPDAGITRTTLIKGLLQNARDKLSLGVPTQSTPNRLSTFKVSSIEPAEKKSPL